MNTIYKNLKVIDLPARIRKLKTEIAKIVISPQHYERKHNLEGELIYASNLYCFWKYGIILATTSAHVARYCRGDHSHNKFSNDRPVEYPLLPVDPESMPAEAVELITVIVPSRGDAAQYYEAHVNGCELPLTAQKYAPLLKLLTRMYTPNYVSVYCTSCHAESNGCVFLFKSFYLFTREPSWSALMCNTPHLPVHMLAEAICCCSSQ